jgi:hypothetical protein
MMADNALSSAIYVDHQRVHVDIRFLYGPRFAGLRHYRAPNLLTVIAIIAIIYN